MLAHLKSRALALGGVASAMALTAVLAAPAAQAAPAAAPVATAAVTNVAFVTDNHRGDRCWRFWGGHWHFVCKPAFHPRPIHRGHPIFHGPVRHHPVFHGPIHKGPVHKGTKH